LIVRSLLAVLQMPPLVPPSNIPQALNNLPGINTGAFYSSVRRGKKRFITLAPVQPPCLQHYQLPQRADQQDEPHSGVQTFR